MAKWGEGDPRWIVEERPDATNVNNWHWTEKNATPWSKDRFNQLFKGVKISSVDGTTECILESVAKCTGEASANNRKGRLIFFYEWELTLEWSGRLEPCDKINHKGKISIPNLSEEHDLEDIEITIIVDESNEESEILKQFMYNFGRHKIREILGVYVNELKEEYSKNLILPKKNEDDQVQEKCKQESSSHKYCKSMSNQNSVEGPTIGYKLDVRTLNIEEDFQCSAYDLYNVLTKQDMVEAFTRAPAKVDASRGGEYPSNFVELVCGAYVERE